MLVPHEVQNVLGTVLDSILCIALLIMLAVIWFGSRKVRK